MNWRQEGGEETPVMSSQPCLRSMLPPRSMFGSMAMQRLGISVKALGSDYCERPMGMSLVWAASWDHVGVQGLCRIGPSPVAIWRPGPIMVALRRVGPAPHLYSTEILALVAMVWVS